MDDEAHHRSDRSDDTDDTDDTDQLRPGQPQPDPLETLLMVQSLDTALVQLEHRRAALPEKVQLAAIERELDTVAAASHEPSDRRAALADQLSELAAQARTVESRIATIERRLYAARGTPSRELQAMDEEVRHLRRRQSDLEDAELELMVELEPLDAELAEHSTSIERLRQDAATKRAQAGDAEAVVDGEISTARSDRDALFSQLPNDLAQRYEALRGKLGGIGAAPLVGNRCEGCHLELPAAEVDRIRHQPRDVVVTCEQCGRILVRSKPTTAP